jgi:beta-alanine--pyruvate transaminase
MAFATYLKCYEMGIHVRFTGDIIAISPPLTIEKNEIDRIFNTLADAIKSVVAAGDAGLDASNYLKNEQTWAMQQHATL